MTIALIMTALMLMFLLGVHVKRQPIPVPANPLRSKLHLVQAPGALLNVRSTSVTSI
jgi:hypothetical protein